MAGHPREHLLSLIDRSIREAAAAGIMMQAADDAPYSGRVVEVGGKKLLNFGGCSYLGLDQRDELKEATIRAVERYGTQFSISRAYLQSPLYEKLESALDEMTDGHTLVGPSTTLSHAAALPVLVQPGDAVLVDRFAHASVHSATALLGSVPVTRLPHGDMDRLEEKIVELSKRYARVFYLVDGLYSMHGDFAPMVRIAELLASHPQLHLYVDDAHSTSWLGRRGRGWALDVLPDRSRVVVALSLNKAFSAAGGALVFPTAEARAMVRRCGGPMLFSGPIPPPMLGAALASAELHLRSDFADLQRGLAERIGLASFIANELGLSFANEDASPIFFVRCGTFESLFPLMQSLLARGLFVCPGGFPAVAKDQSGVRFTLSIHNSEADIRAFLETLVAEMNAHGVPLRPKVPESADRVVAARRVRSSSVPPSRGSACT
jgi:7-keto-8-aminopelargonate synthetase-like enzyme